MAKNVAKAIIGEDEFRGELRPSSRCLLRLFSGFGYAGACGLERGRRSCGFRIRDRSGGGGGGGGRAVTRPVAWAPALVASCWCCRCILHFFSFSLTSMFFYDFFFFFLGRGFLSICIYFFFPWRENEEGNMLGRILLSLRWAGPKLGSESYPSQPITNEAGFLERTGWVWASSSYLNLSIRFFIIIYLFNFIIIMRMK